MHVKRIFKISNIHNICNTVCVLVTQLCRTLCNPMYCRLPGSSVHGILQPRFLEKSFPSSGDLANPGIKPASLALTGRFFTAEPPGKPHLSSDDTNGNQYTLDTFHMPGLHCFSWIISFSPPNNSTDFTDKETGSEIVWNQSLWLTFLNKIIVGTFLL